MHVYKHNILCTGTFADVVSGVPRYSDLTTQILSEMEGSTQVLLLTIILISMSMASKEIFYVLPENSTSTNCSLQPCATLGQYLLDNNGSLPVVSNVEYDFLPGEHHIPVDMKLQYLHNFTITASFNRLWSVMLFIHLHSNLEIRDSINLTISNVMFRTYDNEYSYNYDDSYGIVCNVILNKCFSCKLINVFFLHYGVCGNDLIGNTYLNKIGLDFTLHRYNGIDLYYSEDSQSTEHTFTKVVINGIIMDGNVRGFHTRLSPVMIIRLPNKAINNMTFIISNSRFQHLRQPLIYINNGLYATNTQIWIVNCIFQANSYTSIKMRGIWFRPMINIKLLQYNMTIRLAKCDFVKNRILDIILFEVVDHDYSAIPVNTSCVFSSKVSVTTCNFIKNRGSILNLCSYQLPPCAHFAFIEDTHYEYNKNYDESIVITITNLPVYVSGYCDFLSNEIKAVMSIQSSHISLNGKINLLQNEVESVLIFKSSTVLFNGVMTISRNKKFGSIMEMHSCNVTFNGSNNIHGNVNTSSEYIIHFVSCDVLFSKNVTITYNLGKRIIALKSDEGSTYIKVMEYSYIIIARNVHTDSLIVVENYPAYNNPYPFCLFQYIALQNTSTVLPSHYSLIITDIILHDCELSFHHFISHCKWMPTAVFYGHNPGTINQQIIQLHYVVKHSTIFYCLDPKNFTLGPVYPGQKLQETMCMPCSNNHSVLFAETHNTLLPKSACKIAHQSELVLFTTNSSITVSYTIVSEAIGSCELFLTVSPFLYYIYEVFDVQLLPCPIGFTLQNGVCDCDPLLPTNIDTCYIDQSTITRPAYAWISYTQSNTSKYLISDCPMDYCLPFSSNVNLLHPDTQCQFNRTGILCSQCQDHLSMVFGSSRCMKCTNVYILIIIIFILAGIVLIALLYFLNLTVTKATINGIILYTNIVSINGLFYLVNDSVFSPLRVFISFLNLDLGIELCFYSGMSSYAKMWLQLFFPSYLMILAFSIIIASRYSLRILRLTYTRSLPVLATLFLLSYTSVLRTVLTVSFSYSTITHAPSGHKELVWSIDASISLFGVKFILLFISCLVLFLILLFFNIILLFTRYLAWFKLVNHFKPILDAFQASYKERYYYWIAVHIILRSVFFVLYAFPTKVRLLLASIILVLYTSCFAYILPNKNKLVNFQELLFLINLTIMHIAALQNSDNMFHVVTNLMISLVFIQMCSIVVYHFLTFTCHCDIENLLQNFKKKFKCHNMQHHLDNVTLLSIPERTYNYSEYRDGLVTDDFTGHQ